MGIFGSSTPDPNWGEDLTLLQDYCIHMQKKTSMFPLRFALHVSGDQASPTMNRPFGARVNLHKRPPPVWLGSSPFPAKYHSRYRDTRTSRSLLSITLLLQRASITQSFLNGHSFVQSHIPNSLYVQLVCPVSTTNSRHAYL